MIPDFPVPVGSFNRAASLCSGLIAVKVGDNRADRCLLVLTNGAFCRHRSRIDSAGAVKCHDENRLD